MPPRGRYERDFRHSRGIGRKYLHLVREHQAQQIEACSNVQVMLTDREKQVLILITDGLIAKEIAAQLGIAVKTIEFHKSRIAKHKCKR